MDAAIGSVVDAAIGSTSHGTKQKKNVVHEIILLLFVFFFLRGKPTKEGRGYSLIKPRSWL